MSDDPGEVADPRETWEPRPVPDVTPETAPFWEGAADGELLLGYCPACELTFFYPRTCCPDCLGDTEVRGAAGTGEVYSYTVPSRISGWPDEHLPLVVAYVELDEGPRMITNVVDCEPEDVRVGVRVTVEFVRTDADGVSVPVFRLAEPRHGRS